MAYYIGYFPHLMSIMWWLFSTFNVDYVDRHRITRHRKGTMTIYNNRHKMCEHSKNGSLRGAS